MASRALILLRVPLLLALALVSSMSSRSASAADCVLLEDFSAGDVGQFPPGWKPRKEEGRPVYAIRDEGGRRFLHAASRGLGIQAGREVAWDLETYPILAWSWRPTEFPKGSDERKSRTNDSALAVYAWFPGSAGSVKSLKYIWSRLVPVGARLTSSAGRTQVRVLRSGADGVGHWVEERADVRADYRERFGSDPPKPVGIAVLTDSDDTGSRAEGDYADFRVCTP